jgi:hypothetical protein
VEVRRGGTAEDGVKDGVGSSGGGARDDWGRSSKRKEIIKEAHTRRTSSFNRGRCASTGEGTDRSYAKGCRISVPLDVDISIQGVIELVGIVSKI